MKSGNLNFLEPSGPLQASNGTALLRFYDMIHLSTAIGLTPDGSGTLHIYTQTVHRTTQIQTTHRTTQITKEQHK